MTDLNKKNQHQVWLKVGDLVVHWPEAQRPLHVSRAKQIAATMDADALGALTVASVGGGKYHICDGQTRAAAVRMFTGDDTAVPCVVVTASTAKEAAEIFLRMNGGREKPGAIHTFNVAVTAREPTAVAVLNVTRKLGLRIELSQTEGSISAVAALLSIHRAQGDEGLTRTLEAIKSIWGLDRAAFETHIMKGFALFFEQMEIVIDPARLAKRIANKFTPGRLMGSAQATKEAFSGSLARAICALLVNAYGMPRNPQPKATQPAPKAGAFPARPIRKPRRPRAEDQLPV